MNRNRKDDLDQITRALGQQDLTYWTPPRKSVPVLSLMLLGILVLALVVAAYLVFFD